MADATLSPRAGRIVVRAPATSANLGPGFDCLGVSLDLWNQVAAVFDEPGGAPAPPMPGLPPGVPNLVDVGARAVFDAAATPMPPVSYASLADIPLGRGLGSSAAAIVCGVLLANAYLGQRFSIDELLNIATRVEGHPDNVAPCLLGGLRVATRDETGSVHQAGIPLPPDLHAAMFMPDVVLSTEHARAALPGSVPFQDAVFNVGRASLLVAALASGQLGLLREATRDRLHQPYRSSLFPAGRSLRAAARIAGALGAFISGAGPTVLALCESAAHAATVKEALEAAARHEGVAGSARVVALTSQGAHVVVA